MSIKIENRNGEEITSVEEWRRLAPPAKPCQWKAGRSAMELARAWFQFGAAAIPQELRELLESRPETRGHEISLAVAELPIRFDRRGGNNRRSDLVFSAGPVAGTVEAKADESFGKRTVGGELWAERSNGSCLFVMPKGPDWNAIRAVIST